MVAEKGAKRKAKEGEAPKDESKAKEVEKEFTEAYDEVKKEVEALVRPFLPVLHSTKTRLTGSFLSICRRSLFPLTKRSLPLPPHRPSVLASIWSRQNSGHSASFPPTHLTRPPSAPPIIAFFLFSTSQLLHPFHPVLLPTRLLWE